MAQIATRDRGNRIRINYWDGDVLDVPFPRNVLTKEAQEASSRLRADVDAVTADNTVLATFRNGKLLATDGIV